jgi:hypothetical protein
VALNKLKCDTCGQEWSQPADLGYPDAEYSSCTCSDADKRTATYEIIDRGEEPQS